MIGKVTCKSYSSKWSKQVRRKCPRCGVRQPAELVDYGKGGQLVFFACGNVFDPKKRKSVSFGGICREKSTP